jgi:FkbM family methyltransferase
MARYVGQIVRFAPDIVRTRTLAPADRAMEGRTWRFVVEGEVIEWDGAYFGGVREIYARRVYFPDSSLRIRPEDTVVDLGCNVGVFTVLAARLGQRVVAVDAQGGFPPLVCHHAAMNGCGHKVEVEHALLGPGTGVFAGGRNVNTGSHGTGVEPQTLTIDELFDRHRIDRAGFLKVDIEGSEFSLFAGDTAWLRRVDRLAMEVHPTHGDPSVLLDACNRHDLRAWLTDALHRPVGALAGPAGGYLFAVR